MNKTVYFDVLLVYNNSIAASASTQALLPFDPLAHNESYNEVYAFFLESCRKQHLKAAFTTSFDVIGPGLCSSYWTFTKGAWKKNLSPCHSSLVFDKFSPTRKSTRTKRELLFSSKDVKPFNAPHLYDLFSDKQKTYDKLASYAIPTITLDALSKKSLIASCKKIRLITIAHPFTSDFSSDIVMKDRFGAGGRRVFKFKYNQYQEMFDLLNRNTRISYIIQPFLNFDQGFTYLDSTSSTDIRFIYLQGKIVQTYIRVAKSGDFRCNEHKGGVLTYLSLSDLPSSLIKKSNLIAKELDKKSSLYSLDFIISNQGNPYLLEGNSGPGLDWNTSLLDNETKAKELIDLIVSNLYNRANPSTLIS